MVKKRNEGFKSKIVIAFVLALSLFLLAIFFGYYLNQKKVERIEKLNKEIQTSINDLELLNDLFVQNPCSNKEYLDYLSVELDKEATRLQYLEETLGKNNPLVIELKKPYTLLLLKHYFAMEKIKNECNKNLVIILFFYSNSPQCRGLSENEGIILGFIKKKYGKDGVMVYALDIDLELQTVSYLKNKYNITKIPSVVINDVTFGYLEKEEIEKIIKNLTNENISINSL